MKPIVIAVALLLNFSMEAATRKDSTFTNPKKALKNPSAVKVLDLRGKGLRCISDTLDHFTNLEVILLGPRKRSMFFYPKGWLYELRLRRLPAGGYAHLQGRGRGRFILNNRYICTLPEGLKNLKKLRLLDIRTTLIDASYWKSQLSASNESAFLWSYDLCTDPQDYNESYENAQKIMKEYHLK